MVQVYYGAWRGLEVAIKVMSADITRQVAAGIEVGYPHLKCPSKGTVLAMQPLMVLLVQGMKQPIVNTLGRAL